MKVYVVIHTYGDYIGYFDSDVLGVFAYKEDAEKCKQDNVKLLDVWSETSSITVKEQEVKWTS